MRLHRDSPIQLRSPDSGGYTTAGNPKHYKFRTTSIRRQTRKQGAEVEPAESNVTIAKESTQNLLELLPDASVAYDRFLKHL